MIFIDCNKKIRVISKRVDYSQQNFKEKRRIWIWLCNVNGAQDNEILLAIKELNLMMLGTQQLLFSKIIWIIAWVTWNQVSIEGLLALL